MAIEYLGVSRDLKDSDRSLNLRVRGDFSLSDSCKIAIERPGQNRPYLAENGWQSNYNKCLIDVVPLGDNDFYLRLPIGLAQHLDSEHNYKVELFNATNESVGVFGMNWAPPPKIRAMPIEPAISQPLQIVDAPPEPLSRPADPEPKPEPKPREPPNRRVVHRTVLNCAHCGGEIFSTFTVCPYCGNAVTQT